ncbi:MAG: hypothetical protein IB618_00605 [Candidatus Pacearchaeota archaeon]|nr:MAG: hypothetical protein IB618_00605 [Candidatus Pacearchaeota archaeon]
MIITEPYFKKIIRNFLTFLEKENISYVADLEQRLDKKFSIDKNPGEYIAIEMRPSNFDTKAYTISYIIPNKGIPIEIKINKALGYSQIIIKRDRVLPSYSLFHIDIFGNMAQNKELKITKISEIKEELKRLKR